MRRLVLRKAIGKAFGRFSGRSIDFGGNDFVVVVGPNESGKSTLADMISWVLAGRRMNHETGGRFVNFAGNPEAAPTITIDGVVEGLVDGRSFDISREFKIRATNKGREPAATPPSISLDAQKVSADDWASTIGIQTGDDYYLRYRITGPYDPENHIEIRDLLESLAVGTSATQSPRKVMEGLERAANSLVHPKSGRNTGRRFSDASVRVDASVKRIKEIEGSVERIKQLEERIDSLGKEARETAEKRRGVAAEKIALSTAGELLESRRLRDGAAAGLAGLGEVPEDLRTAPESRAGIDAALVLLGQAESSVRDAATTFEAARISASVSEDEASALVIDDSVVAVVGDLQSELRRLDEQVAENRETVGRLNSELQDHAGSLSQLATNLGTTGDHLRSIGELALDDASLGDPIRDWSELTARVNTDQITFDSSEAAVKTAEEAVRLATERWERTGLREAPELVAAGQYASPSQRESNRQSASWLVALFIGTAGAAAIFGRWGGVIAAAVSLVVYFAVAKRAARSSGVDPKPSPDAVESAVNLLNARRIAGEADAKRVTAKQVLGDTQRRCDAASRVARAALSAHGFDIGTTIERAAIIRSERSHIRDLVRSIKDVSASIAAADGALMHANGRIAEIEAELSRISTQVGLARLGAKITRETADSLLKVVRTHAQLRGASEKFAAARGEVERRAGDWSVGKTIDDIVSRLDKAASLISERDRLLGQMNLAEQSLAERAPSGSFIAQLLDDVNLTSATVDERINSLDEQINDLDSTRDRLNIEMGGCRQELNVLNAEDDLPIVKQQLEQARLDCQRCATEGAALFLARKLVADVKDEVEKSSQPELVKRASEISEKITDGFWTGFVIGDNGEILVRQDGTWITQEALSAGARDVLRLSIRIAVAQHHADKTGIALPLILDDPTASVDRHRMPRVFSVLADFARTHQVILLTHDPATVVLAVEAGAIEIPMPVA